MGEGWYQPLSDGSVTTLLHSNSVGDVLPKCPHLSLAGGEGKALYAASASAGDQQGKSISDFLPRTAQRPGSVCPRLARAFTPFRDFLFSQYSLKVQNQVG